jgi:hypothetical protein
MGMATDTQLQGAMAPLIISGKEFPAKTLTDRDYTEIDEYIKSEILAIAYSTMRQQELLPSERQEILSAAILAATKVSWYSSEGIYTMNTPKGMARLAWQMCKPGMPFNKFLAIFRTEGEIQENITRTNVIFDQLNRSENDAEVKEAPAESEKS